MVHSQRRRSANLSNTSGAATRRAQRSSSATKSAPRTRKCSRRHGSLPPMAPATRRTTRYEDPTRPSTTEHLARSAAGRLQQRMEDVSRRRIARAPMWSNGMHRPCRQDGSPSRASRRADVAVTPRRAISRTSAPPPTCGTQGRTRARVRVGSCTKRRSRKPSCIAQGPHARHVAPLARRPPPPCRSSAQLAVHLPQGPC